MPQKVAKPLDKDPLMDRVDGQIGDGLGIQFYVSYRFAGSSRGQKILVAIKYLLDDQYHQKVVESDSATNQQPSKDPMW